MLILIFKLVFIASRPVCRINTLFNRSMKSGIRPFVHHFYQAMLERIDVNVIHVRPEIFLITNQMFPVTPLPYAAFTSRYSNRGTLLGTW